MKLRHPYTNHCKPFPEIVEELLHGTPYEILDSNRMRGLPTNGMTDKVDRKLIVPLTPAGRPVSRHELAHVKWSPLRMPRTKHDPRVLMAVEDARINLGLDRIGIPVRLSHGEVSYVTYLGSQDIGRGDHGAFVLRSIASIGTNAIAEVRAAAHDAPAFVRDLLRRHLPRIEKRLDLGARLRRSPVASFRLARQIARELATELEALGLIDSEGPFSSRHICVSCCLGAHAPESEGEETDLRIAGRPERADGAGGVQAGSMTLVQAPLTVNCRLEKGRKRRFRPASEGSVPAYMHRLPIDGAVFRRQTRTHGGTVLVDTSGSMSLGVGGVERILADAPYATLVAIYSGRGGGGQLRIVARNGKRAAARDLEPYGHANVVDLPALEWLATQPEPRVWISDGHVTGVDDRSDRALHRRCNEICKRARIQRVRKVEQAAALVSR